MSLDFDISNMGCRWTFLAPRDQLGKLSLFSFSDNFDVAVRAIPHPTLEYELTSAVSRGGAVVYSLDSPLHDHVNPFHILGSLP